MFEFQHHGVKGQHWGKRNGPPYPLEGDDKARAKKSYKEPSRAEKKRRVNNKKSAKPMPEPGSVEREIAELFKQNPKLRRDFGGSVKKVDDPEFVEYIAGMEYGMDVSKLTKAINNKRNISTASKDELKTMWYEGEEVEEAVFNKLAKDPKIRKQAEEKAKKDGLKPGTKEFKYWVYGDTPSENYLTDAIISHQEYREANNFLYEINKEMEKRGYEF